jgi:hypothetical protein
MSQATASNHPKAFTFTLLLSEGRAGEAWEPSIKRCSFFLPTIKFLSLFPRLFTSNYSSTVLATPPPPPHSGEDQQLYYAAGNPISLLFSLLSIF